MSENIGAYFAGLTTGMIIFWCIVSIFIWLLTIIAHWKIFTKAGKPGWASLIPFYNAYVLFQISGFSGWMFLLLLIPFVDFVVLILLYYKLSKAFGKGVGYTLGLLFLNTIFTLILGLGSSKYVGCEK